MADPTDMSGQYNTALSSGDQEAYAQWLAAQTQAQGRDVSADARDYDMQGAYKAGAGRDDASGHMTDQFKKPSHPTFSTESQYHGVDGHEGGTWKDLGNGKWSFTPGATNLKHRSPQQLEQYLRRADPDTKLTMPEEVQ